MRVAMLDGPLLAAGAVVSAVAAASVASGRGVTALAASLAVPVVAAILERPQRGLLLLAALVPFDGLLLLVPDSGGVAGWKEALVLAVVAATFVAPAHARRQPGPLPPWLTGVVGFGALGLVSAALVGGQQGLLGAKVALFYLLVALAVWRCPLGPRDRDRLVTILMLTGAATATYGVVQQMIGAVRLNELGYEYNSTIRFAGGYLRSFSTFVQPFPFGFFLMLVLLVGLPHVLGEPRRLRSRLFACALPLLLAGLATSVVRGAWIGLAVGVVYLALTRHRVLLLAVPVALFGVVLLPDSTTSAVFSSTSSEERVAGWQDNVERVVEHPLGEGLGATGAVAERLRDEASEAVPGTAYQPDNYFVKTAIELGVAGLWLFVLVLVAAFTTAHRRASAAGRDGTFAAGTAAYIAAAAAACTVSTFFEIFPMELYFWLLLTAVSAMVAVPDRAPDRNDARPPILVPA